MNKKIKHDAVNNQEDEDGYSAHVPTTMADTNIKLKPGIGFHGTAINIKTGLMPAGDEDEWFITYMHSIRQKLRRVTQR